MKAFRTHIALVVLLVLSSAAPALQTLFTWGVVRWDSGAPAAGLEVRLVQGSTVRARTYTNALGRYGFFGVEGTPAQYRVQIISGKRTLTERGLRDVARGEQVPDMTVQ